MTNSQSIVIIDGMNAFMRSYLGNQEVATDGTPMGGVVGFLRLIRKLMQEQYPKEIIVVFEQGGASKRRKKIHEGYKAQSAFGGNSVNKSVFENEGSFKQDLLDDEKLKANQLLLLTKLLKLLFVKQVYVKGVEGDDASMFLCKEVYGPSSPYKDSQKIVVTGDKDYYQLLTDDSVRIYNPIRRMIVSAQDAQNEFEGVHINNLVVAKSFIGDKSDSIDGVKGMGFKSLMKFYPFFGEEKEYLLEEAIAKTEEIYREFASAKKPKIPVCVQNAHDNLGIVRRNYKLMYIGSDVLTTSQKQQVQKQAEQDIPNTNMVEYLRLFQSARMMMLEEHSQLFQEAQMLFQKTGSKT